MLKFLTIAFLALVSIATLPDTASAGPKQCIKNDSGTSLSVQFYLDGNKKKGNKNLTVGFEVCQNIGNDNKLAFATVKCNGCAWAEGAAKTAVIVAGTGAFGVCVVATAGECVAEIPLFVEATALAVSSIPPSFKGKLIVVPGYNKTTHINGNAFGLHIQ